MSKQITINFHSDETQSTAIIRDNKQKLINYEY